MQQRQMKINKLLRKRVCTEKNKQINYVLRKKMLNIQPTFNTLRIGSQALFDLYQFNCFSSYFTVRNPHVFKQIVSIKQKN